MTIKTILAPISGGEQDHVTLATAFRVAKTFGAHVDVLFTRLSPTDAVPLVGEGMSSSVVEQLLQAAEREWATRADNAKLAFADAAAQAEISLHDTPPGPGTATCAWREEVGREEEVVVRASHLADLVVLARPLVESDDLQLTLTLEAALMSGGRPLLLAPPHVPETIGRTVAVAWRDTIDSAHAVTGAMPFLRKAKTIVVLTAATPRTHPDRANELIDYLAWHGIEAEKRFVDVGPEGVGGALLTTAGAEGADLLVMGGYGHSRMREMILGGVTRYVLGHARMPVLMAH